MFRKRITLKVIYKEIKGKNQRN